jgi:carboxypeptidase family protein
MAMVDPVETPGVAGCSSPRWPRSCLRTRLESVAVASMLLLLAGACAHARVDAPLRSEDPPESPIKGYAAAIDRASVLAQHIEGIVLDARDGQPMSNAHLILYLKDSRLRGGRAAEEVLTNAGGHFELTVADTGMYEFQARLAGFTPISRDLHVGPLNGIDVVVRMAVDPLRLCPRIITYPHSVAVRVVDAVTGAPITTGASLEIIDGRYRAYANSGDAAPAGMTQDSSLLVAGNRRGKFEVIVRHPDYVTWRAREVSPLASDCGVSPASLIARMIPDS